MRSLSDLFRNFLQLGYVTDDIDAAASYLESEYVRQVTGWTSAANAG